MNWLSVQQDEQNERIEVSEIKGMIITVRNTEPCWTSRQWHGCYGELDHYFANVHFFLSLCSWFPAILLLGSVTDFDQLDKIRWDSSWYLKCVCTIGLIHMFIFHPYKEELPRFSVHSNWPQNNKYVWDRPESNPQWGHGPNIYVTQNHYIAKPDQEQIQPVWIQQKENE